MKQNKEDKFQKTEDKETKFSRNSNKRGNSKKSNSRRSSGNKGNTSRGGRAGLYMNIGQLALDASRISTYNAAGAKNPSISFDDEPYTPAGIMRLDYVPYFGEIDSAIDPLNVAAKNLYDIINSKNSRNPSYDPSDLMIYIIAVANAWGLHSFVTRICGMYNTFDPTNRYWWKPILETMNVSPISVQNDIVTWRQLANRMALNLNRLAVPNNIPYFAEVIEMCRNIYRDSETDKSSLYYFNPAAFMRYKYGDDELGVVRNEVTPWSLDDQVNPVTPADIEDYFNRLVVNLFNDTDINTIASDIIKAFGIENCFRLPMVDETYFLLPIYDPEVNLMVHNARICGNLIVAGVQDEYRLQQNMTINALTTSWGTETFAYDIDMPDSAIFIADNHAEHQIPLDFPYDNPDESAIMLATRFTLWADQKTPGTVIDYIQGTTFAIINAEVYSFDMDSENQWVLNSETDVVYVPVTAAADSIQKALQKLSYISKFHDAPITYVVRKRSGDEGFCNPVWSYMVSDVANFTTVSRQVLKNLREAALFSIFNIAGNRTKSE